MTDLTTEQAHELIADVVWFDFTHATTYAYDVMNAECGDMECSTCAQLVCQFEDPLHFHHDGCPSCAVYWDEVFASGD